MFAYGVIAIVYFQLLERHYYRSLMRCLQQYVPLLLVRMLSHSLAAIRAQKLRFKVPPRGIAVFCTRTLLPLYVVRDAVRRTHNFPGKFPPCSQYNSAYSA